MLVLVLLFALVSLCSNLEELELAGIVMVVTKRPALTHGLLKALSSFIMKHPSLVPQRSVHAGQTFCYCVCVCVFLCVGHIVPRLPQAELLVLPAAIMRPALKHSFSRTCLLLAMNIQA